MHSKVYGISTSEYNHPLQNRLGNPTTLCQEPSLYRRSTSPALVHKLSAAINGMCGESLTVVIPRCITIILFPVNNLGGADSDEISLLIFGI